jgi:hypothetical protein
MLEEELTLLYKKIDELSERLRHSVIEHSSAN